MTWPAWPGDPSEVGSTLPTGTARPTRRRLGLAIAAVAIAAVVMVTVAGLGAFLVWSAFSGDDEYPSAWDPAVGRLVPEVEELRDLSFKHPVGVTFLTDAEFREYVAVDEELDPAYRKSLREAESLLRTVGLIGGPVDLLAALDTSQRSSVLALYDSEEEKIVVRGEPPLDVSQRVTLVHELVHVLQDQHFDIEALGERVEKSTSGSEDALVALIEGDASRIEAEYVEGLPAAQRRAYDEQEESEIGRVDDELADVPAVVTTLLGAPYAYGPWVVQALVADDGNEAVDRALRRATFTQQIFTDALSVLDPAEPEPVPRVIRGEGERAIGEVESFGAFDLYLVLASRIEPSDALEIAQGWAGGRERIVGVDGGACMLANIVGVDEDATDAIRQGLEAWAGAGPEGVASVTDVDGLVGLRVCDPNEGDAGTSPDAEVERAEVVLVLYDSLLVSSFAEATEFDVDVSNASLECISFSVVRDPGVAELTMQPQETLTEEEVGEAIDEAIPVALEECGLSF